MDKDDKTEEKELKPLDTTKYIIDTKGREIKVQDVTRNKKMQALLAREAEGKLADDHPEVRNYRVASVATNFDDASMYQDPATIVYETTPEGYIVVDDYDDCVDLLKRLQTMDKSIDLATFGRTFANKKIYKAEAKKPAANK